MWGTNILNVHELFIYNAKPAVIIFVISIIKSADNIEIVSIPAHLYRL